MKVSFLLTLIFPLFVFSQPVKQQQKTEEKPYDHDLFRNKEEVLFTNFEFLYWTINQGALDYAIKMKEANANPNIYAMGDMERAEFGWDPGFRVNVGYFNAPKYWEVFAQYTWMKVSGKDSVNKPDPANVFLTGTWPQIFSNNLLRAISKIRNQYNVVDLIVDRVFHPNPHLRFRVYTGLCAAFIGQKWKINYTDGANNTEIFNRFRFRGGGIKLMASFDWYWGADFYITGKTSIAALIGRYKNLARQSSTGFPGLLRDVTLKDIRMTYTSMFVFGPSWQKSFEKSRIEIFAGYEFTSWFNLDEIYRSTSGAANAAKETWLNRGLFSLQGLTTRLTFDF